MPAPTSYTEAQVALYMRNEIQGIADDLNAARVTDSDPDWLDVTAATTSAYREPINDVELALNIADVANYAGDPELVRLHADVAVWDRVLKAYVRAYSIGGMARTLQRDQLFDHASVMLSHAQDALQKYITATDVVDRGYPTSIPPTTFVPIRYVW